MGDRHQSESPSVVQQASAPPGRPRSAAAGRAILDATLRLLTEHGYAAMSVEGVAAAAGVGKTTIYRRYKDKKELVAAALASLIADAGPAPDSGDTRADLLALVRQFHRLFMDGPVLAIAGTLLVEGRRNPDLLARFREAAIRPGRARVRAVIERGIQRGTVRPDVDADAAVDALIGAFFARYLAGLDTSPRSEDALVGLLWCGLAAPDS